VNTGTILSTALREAVRHLTKAGLAADDRERLHVDAFYRTKVGRIYAVGDVIGFPALASTAMEQGRLAACHAYGVPTCSIPELFLKIRLKLPKRFAKFWFGRTLNWFGKT